MTQMLRVLIVDDEASQRAGLAGMVTAWGMVSETASDGGPGVGAPLEADSHGTRQRVGSAV